MMKILRAAKQTKGLTLVEVIVLIFVIALLAAMFLPALAGMKQKHSRIGCVNYLKEIGLGIKM
jgi:competence protein ComGC